MAEMKFYIIGPEAAGLKAWADDSGKDKPVEIYGLPDDTPPGSIVICEGRWKFNRGEGYSFLAQSHDIIKQGIGGSITIKCLISRMLYACGAGINGIWVTRGKEAEGSTLLTSEGVNKITLYGIRRNESVRFTPQPDTDYTLEIRNKVIFLAYRVTDESGKIVADFSISYSALICALLMPLAGLVSACAYYAKGNGIGTTHSLLTSYLSWFLWAMAAAFSGLNVPLTSLFGAAWAVWESVFMQ